MEKKEVKIKNKIDKLLPHLNERQRRIFLSAEAENIGYGGISIISRLSKVSRPTILYKAKRN